jgi:putative aldouronate transport system substrate-binding protein
MNIDPETNETYNTNYWASYLKANQTALITAWQEKYQAKNPMDYYTKNKLVDVVPQINMSFGADTSDIKNKRSQCSELVKNTSWKMIFAKNQAEFDQLWTKLKTDLDGLGWKDVVAQDTATCKTIADARAQAMATVK